MPPSSVSPRPTLETPMSVKNQRPSSTAKKQMNVSTPSFKASKVKNDRKVKKYSMADKFNHETERP